MQFLKLKKNEALKQFLIVWRVFYLLTIAEQAISSMSMDAETAAELFVVFPVMCGVFAFIIVSHYYLLHEQYVRTKKYWRYALLVPLFYGTMVLADLSAILTITRAGALGGVNDSLYKLLTVSAMRVAGVMLLTIVYAMIRAYQRAERIAEQAAQDNLANEMQLLQYKMEPDFVYNTINKLQQLAIAEDAPQTAAYMNELKELFSYSAVTATKERIAVIKEMSFLTRYISLQKMRIATDRNIVINTSIKGYRQPAEIAPMLLLPFIENAFKYGISYQEYSMISVDISIADNTLYMRIENNDHSKKKEQLSTGTGIENAVKRLELEYAHKYELRQENTNGIYGVSLKLNLN